MPEPPDHIAAVRKTREALYGVVFAGVSSFVMAVGPTITRLTTPGEGPAESVPILGILHLLLLILQILALLIIVVCALLFLRRYYALPKGSRRQVFGDL